MTKVLAVLFKLLILILILVILAIPVAALTWWLQWNLKIAIFVYLGLIGAWIGILFIRRLFFRRREKEFVRRVVAQDDKAIQNIPLHDRQELLDLQESWRVAIGKLKTSKLRRQGNPLYVLPWFMVIGEPGSGKTSAIQNSELSSPLTEISSIAGISGTRNCDWWFFDQAIILDTAGRYAIPIDEGLDKAEWERFLGLLAKYRKKEPLNGLIVTISADKLLTANESVLREDGLTIRKRIDHLMRVCGAKFPVYILVTKTDLVNGMKEFCSFLTSDQLAQSMGYTNDKFIHKWKDFLDEAVSGIVEKLKELRFIMVHKDKVDEPGALIFPDELNQLRKGLALFSQKLFEDNEFRETPLFRGLFFSSASQNGTVTSSFLSQLGLVPLKYAPSDSGIFLRDFFKRVLPADRWVLTPIAEFMSWKKLVNHLGLLSWVFIWTALCGILTFSFINSTAILNDFRDDFAKQPVLSSDLSTDLIMLKNFKLEIEDIQADRGKWMLPHFGLNYPYKLEKLEEETFTKLFKKGVLLKIFDSVNDKTKAVNSSTLESTIEDLAGFMVTIIAMVDEFIDKGNDSFIEYLRKATPFVVEYEGADVVKEMASHFPDLMVAYLNWTKDNRYIKHMQEEYKTSLKILLESKGTNLHWLALRWIPEAEDIRLGQFWGVTAYNEYEVTIPGAFSVDGKANIQQFITLIKNAIGEDERLQKMEYEFWRWYEQEYYAYWLTFAKQFSQGTEMLHGESEWKDMASVMSTEQNPYFLFMQRMAEELKPYKKSLAAPQWVSLVLEMEKVRAEAVKEEKAKQKNSTVAKLTLKGEKVVRDSIANISPKDARKIEHRSTVADIWYEYSMSLKSLNVVSSSDDTAFKLVSEYYPDAKNSDQSTSPFYKTYSMYMTYKNLMKQDGDYVFFWDLSIGPFRYLIEYSVMETSCKLQGLWDTVVLSSISGIGKDKAANIMFNKTDGSVWQYVNGLAAPFIGKGKNGYYANKALGRKIPFDDQFFTLLNEGAQGVLIKQDEYKVSIGTLPMEVSHGADKEPYESIIELSCAEKKQRLENYNYKSDMDFTWKPDSCGDMSITIKLPGIELKKTYVGTLGFGAFLKDFRNGSHIFKSDEFGDQADTLKDMGIQWIKLSYNIQGAADVIKLLNNIPASAPDIISRCW